MNRMLLSSALLAVFLVGCAVNPATGKRQIMLVSEQEEIEIGRESDRAIRAEMGLYDDDELQQYVDRLGQELAERSERPHLEWTFRLVDDPIINAFALPGGYIYITRGILAHMSSEAELVSVLGHEIGHVTGRHGANQLSKQQLAQVGMGAGSIIAPEVLRDFGELAQMGVSMMFLKYGRDHERQADDLGLRYMLRAGYDPSEMADMFDMLERVSAGQRGSVPSWMSTHPAPDDRRERIEKAIRASGDRASGGRVNEEGFLELIDNITFGKDPREGYFTNDNVFVHPGMEFRFDFPDGWKVQNLRQAVIGQNKDGDAILQLTISGASSPQAALDRFLDQDGVGYMGPAMQSINGLPTAGSGFIASLRGVPVKGRIGYVEHRGRVFELLGYAVDSRWEGREKAIRRALASFDRVSDPAVLDVQPKRLRVVRLGRDRTLEEFARDFDATVSLKKLAQLNRLDPGEILRAGRTYKVVVGGRLP